MAELQKALIYIEKENIEEAEFMSRNFVNPEIKKRAYLNALGSELVMKYLASEGIGVENLHNIHSISKILENYDISDILLPNIHIDVRVVFDKKQIFIPKSHFENEILPDVYAVITIGSDFKTAEFLGYIETSSIDKSKKNSDYYFVEPDQLTSAENLAQYIKNYVGKTPRYITEEEMLRGRQLSVSLADHNITKFEEKELLELLLISDGLRESVLEFDNFETLAYSAAPELIKSLENTVMTAPILQETEDLSDAMLEGDTIPDDTSNSSEESIEALTEDDIIEETPIEEDFSIEQSETESNSVEEEATEILADSVQTPIEEDLLGDNMLNDGIALTEDISPIGNIKDIESITEETIPEELEEQAINSEQITTEQVVNDNEITPLDIESISITDEPITLDTELSVDALLDQTIASIDAPAEEPETDIAASEIEPPVQKETTTLQTQKEEKSSDSNIAEKIVDAAGKAIAATAVGAIAAGAATTTTEATVAAAGAVASEGAIKLAGVAGEIIDDVLNDNIQKQGENLDKIDFEKIGENPEAKEISPEAESIDNLSSSKLEENMKNEQSGEFDAPKDLSSLDKIDTIASETQEQVYVHETVDMFDMETVENDLYREEDNSGVDIDTLTDLEAVIKKEEELTEAHILSESEVVDLPDAAGFTISEDGTSSFDDMMSEENFPPKEDTDNLVDIKPIEDENIIGSLNLDEQPVQAEENTITEDIAIMDLSEIQPLEEIVENSEQETISEDVSQNNTTDTSLAALDELDLAPIEEVNASLPADNTGTNITDGIDLENINIEPLAEETLNTDFTGSVIIEENTLEQIGEFVNEDLSQNTETRTEESVETVTETPSNENTEETLETISLNTNDNIIQDDTTAINNENLSIEEFPTELLEETATDETSLESFESITENQSETQTSETTGIDEPVTLEETFEDTETVTDENSNEELTLDDFEQLLTEDTQQESTGDIEKEEEASIDDFLNDAVSEDIQEVSLEDQQWLSEEVPTGNIADAVSALTDDEIITEPVTQAPAQIYQTIENSTPISDKTFKAGEIPIDINNNTVTEFDGPESLEELYNKNSQIPGEALLNNPGRMSSNKNQQKSPVGAILGFVGVLIILAVVGAVGFGVAKMFKAPQEEVPQPITDDATPVDTNISDNNTLNVNPNNVVSMDNNTDALASTSSTVGAAPAGQSATAARATGTATAFVDIKKLTWEVPDYISANASFKQYFQSAGKSLKNALTTDLLLATDYIYSSPVKVSVTFEKDGAFKNSQMINSSGSTQIDSIVLQTVNQTFKSLKAPHSVGNDESTTAILKIYF